MRGCRLELKVELVALMLGSFGLPEQLDNHGCFSTFDSLCNLHVEFDVPLSGFHDVSELPSSLRRSSQLTVGQLSPDTWVKPAEFLKFASRTGRMS